MAGYVGLHRTFGSGILNMRRRGEGGGGLGREGEGG